MRDSPSACVADACVIIDLHVGGLLPAALRRPFQLIAPDFIVDELVNPGGEELVRDGLQKESLTPEEISELAELRERHSSELSVNDVAALFVAKKKELMLLTGERLLRQAAEAQGVTVRGTPWLLEQMVRHRVLDPSRARTALLRLRQAKRLPIREAERLLAKWKPG